MDGLNKLLDAVETKMNELEGDTPVTSTSDIKAASKDTSLFKKIISDPDIELGESDAKGNQIIYCKGKDIGWYNPNTNECWVDDNFNNGEESITAATKIETRSDLEQALKDVLDSDLCAEVVNMAFSEDGTFETDVFMDTDDFFDAYLSDIEPKDLVLKFFNGEDLDSNGKANPNRDYLRFNGAQNIESTDYPGDIYFDLLLNEIVEYIMDHLDDREYNDYIQDIIDEYLENSKEEE